MSDNTTLADRIIAAGKFCDSVMSIAKRDKVGEPRWDRTVLMDAFLDGTEWRPKPVEHDESKP